MQFELSETQQLLQKTARQFLTNECPIAEVRKRMETDNPHDAALHKKMAEQGWTGMIFPEEYGGMALGMVELAATFEQMGRVLLPGAFFSTVALAGSIIDAAGNHEQKAKWLTPTGFIVRGLIYFGIWLLLTTKLRGMHDEEAVS